MLRKPRDIGSEILLGLREIKRGDFGRVIIVGNKEPRMAKESRQKQFEQEFRRHIERHGPALIKALGSITTAKPPPEIKMLCFEIEPDWREFPAQWTTKHLTRSTSSSHLAGACWRMLAV
jgi:hypothetical protein